MKKITITIPDNCELKQKGNSYTIVEKKKLTYNDIAKKLFENKQCFYTNATGEIVRAASLDLSFVEQLNNCTSRKQVEKILAINKLMNVAKCLNCDWQPDWDYRHEMKYYIIVVNGIIGIYFEDTVQSGNVYFKSQELARQAIEILGEKTIKLALCTDY